MGLGLDYSLLLGLASFLTGGLTAVVGVGGGVALLAVMASLLPGPAIIPLHGFAQAYANSVRAGLNHRHIQWPVVSAFMVGMVLGTILAGFLVVNLPPSVIKIGLGVFVVIQTTGLLPASLFVKPGQRLLSSISIGVMSMFFGAPGPLVAAAIHQMGVEKQGYNGTHAMVMVVRHGSKLVTFLLLGFAYMAYLDAIIAIVIGSTLGTLIGQQLMTRLSPNIFRKGLTIVLVLIGVQLVGSGLYSIL